MLLTGAEAIAKLLKEFGVSYAFGYPGTSELALCAAVQAQGIEMVNSRGDAEAAFMAAGGSLHSPFKAVSILHGARGGTNAIGAICASRRNEVGALHLVGLPSTSSARFLPPHGEYDLMEHMGAFGKTWYEVRDTTASQPDAFVNLAQTALRDTVSKPGGPVLLGLPQDIMEKRWIPERAIANQRFPFLEVERPSIGSPVAEAYLLRCRHPVILFDTMLLRWADGGDALIELAETLNAPILQVHYRRGPMLFPSLVAGSSSHYWGWYNPQNVRHHEIMQSCDLLITVEDRNMYPRIVGSLPRCAKIAVTSNPGMTNKNEYLLDGDVLLGGETPAILRELSSIVRCRARPSLSGKSKTTSRVNIATQKWHPKYRFLRQEIAEELCLAFSRVAEPFLVDDSQMFGGVLSESQYSFPKNLRIFGDHGAFVGGGISFAAGFAMCHPDCVVFCTLGDQAFTNSLQGLVSAVAEKVKIVYVLCNNGRSVSLEKQLHHDNPTAFSSGKDKFLKNSPLHYGAVASSIGASVFSVRFDPDSSRAEFRSPRMALRDALKSAIACEGVALIELCLPSSIEAWDGIWEVSGNELIANGQESMYYDKRVAVSCE